MPSSFSRNAYRSSNPSVPRKIELFEDPKEFLMAIHDAIKEHQQVFIATGKIHGNINTDTIYIGSKPTSPEAHGFLVDSPTVNPMFQSVNVTSKSILKRKDSLPVDYFDDLESFYYIIAFISMAYSAPGVRLRTADFPFMLSAWAAEPHSRTSALEKEAMFFGDGFACRFGPSILSQNYQASHIFESLLEYFHSTLKAHYNEKLLLRRNIKLREMLETSSDIYDNILWQLKLSVRMLEEGSKELQV